MFPEHYPGGAMVGSNRPWGFPTLPARATAPHCTTRHPELRSRFAVSRQNPEEARRAENISLPNALCYHFHGIHSRYARRSDVMKTEEADHSIPFVLLGSTTVLPDILYATHFNAPDAVSVVRHPDGRIVLLVSQLEYGRAKEQSRGCEVPAPDSTKNRGTAGRLADYLLHEKIAAVEADSTFPFGAVKALEQAGIEVRLSGRNPFAAARMVKSPEEIAAIRATQTTAKQAAEYIGEVIRGAEVRENGILFHEGTSLTGERARRLVRSFLLERGIMDFEGTICAPGIQAVNPHESGHGPIRANEWVVCDIFPRDLQTGYWGDVTRTWMNGEPSPERKRLYQTVSDAQRLALSMLRPGIAGSSVHKAVEDFFLDNGYQTGVDGAGRYFGFFHSTGHGVGLEIHEQPCLGSSPQILTPGNGGTVEPGLYYPEIGGVRIDDTVMITETGCEIL